jgi:hypothetical protein
VWVLGAIVGLALAVVFGGCAAPPKETGDLVWPLPPDEPRIKYVRAFCCTNDFGKSGMAAITEKLFGTQGTKMAKPYGVATDKDGKIYVANTGNFRPQIFGL